MRREKDTTTAAVVVDHGEAHDCVGRRVDDPVDHGYGRHYAGRGAAPERGHQGHGDHGGHVAMFRRLFWGSLVLAVPAVLLSGMFADLVGYTLPDVPGLKWASPALGTMLYGWFGRPFLTGAASEIRARRPGMMLLVALAITVAFTASWGATLGLLAHHLDFWWELALLVMIMLLGHWIEMRSLARTTSALDSLAALLPDQAERVEGDQVVVVDPAALVVGDVIIVRPGGSVPADGRVVDGSASMDEAMITGESKPVRRSVGDDVVAGTVATDSGLRVEVTAIGDETALAGIQKLVADAQASGSRAQRLADTAAGWLFWFALGSALVTALVWALMGMPDEGVIRTITVLVIACPHALGLAIPLVISISTERAARGGVLVKDRLQMESMRGVDSVLFDKTGTLTKGQPTVTAVETADRWDLGPDALLGLAASAESDSEHPLARAIVRAARERDLELAAAGDFSSSPAVGVSATVDGKRVQVGGPALLEEVDGRELAVADAWRDEGAIILHVVVDGMVAGALRLADEIRPESRAAVAALHERGVEVVMITGDAEAVAASVAAELGIDRYYAGVRPEDKSSKVAALQAEGRRVAMVGDGVNDAPALAQADVGIAIGAGTDVAIGSAGIILASDDPRSVISVIDLSKATYRKSLQNLAWGAGYNLAAVPLAAGVLAPIGFLLPMSVGAVLMSASTVVVALNAQLLRRLDLSPGVAAPLTESPDDPDDQDAPTPGRIEVGVDRARRRPGDRPPGPMNTLADSAGTRAAGSVDTRNRREAPTLTKLAGSAVLLAAVFAVTLLVGGQVGSIDRSADADHADTHTRTVVGDDMDETSGGHVGHQSSDPSAAVPTADELPGGLRASQDGYTFVLDRTALAVGTRDIAFRIDGPDGRPVSDYEVEHEKELHLIAVRRDFTGFQHVHPVRGADGTWSTRLHLTAGTWRLFADFAPAPADGQDPAPLTLGADLAVTGPAGGRSDLGAAASGGDSRIDVVDGHRVELTGDLTSGEESDLRFTVTRDGRPVTELQPYLGARGHLVALREVDLAYLHVHPTDDTDAAGDEVGFGAAVPSVGGYRLYLDFRVDDVVRTASFALTAPAAGTAGDRAERGGADGHPEDDHAH